MRKRGGTSNTGLDKDVQNYIRALRQAGAPVSGQLVQAAAENIITAKDRNLLIENVGHIALSRGWASSLLKRMGYVKRKATTKRSILSDSEFQAQKHRFLLEISGMVTEHKIPDQLVLNWDQTGLQLVPSGNWTLEEQGTKRVELQGLNDKRMITAIFTCSLSGHFLPMQLLYTRKTSRCHPSFEFPPEFDVWHSPNHWANQDTTLRFVNHVIVPYVKKVRQEMKLRSDYPALVIFDVFRGQAVKEVHELLEENLIYVVKVLSNCTDKLQPLHLSVNKPTKDYIRQKFCSWYAEKVKAELDAGKSPDSVSVDLKMSVIKEVGARWLVSLYDYFLSNPSIVRNGFVQAGIAEAISNLEKINESTQGSGDPFSDLCGSDSD